MKCPAQKAASHWIKQPGNSAITFFGYEDALQQAKLALHERPGATSTILYRRIIDAVRQSESGYRQRSTIRAESMDDSVLQIAGSDDVFEMVAAREQIAALKGRDKKAALIEMRKPARKVDLSGLTLHVGEPLPPLKRKAGGRYADLLEAMPATGHYVMDRRQAASLVSEMKRAGVRYATRTLEGGKVGVWREPTAEQLRGIKT
jgi:hypothetical protein